MWTAVLLIRTTVFICNELVMTSENLCRFIEKWSPVLWKKGHWLEDLKNDFFPFIKNPYMGRNERITSERAARTSPPPSLTYNQQVLLYTWRWAELPHCSQELLTICREGRALHSQGNRLHGVIMLEKRFREPIFENKGDPQKDDPSYLYRRTEEMWCHRSVMEPWQWFKRGKY